MAGEKKVVTVIGKTKNNKLYARSYVDKGNTTAKAAAGGKHCKKCGVYSGKHDLCLACYRGK